MAVPVNDADAPAGPVWAQVRAGRVGFIVALSRDREVRHAMPGDTAHARLTVELWARLYRVNVIGAFLCAKAVAPGMLARGQGSIDTIQHGPKAGITYRC